MNKQEMKDAKRICRVIRAGRILRGKQQTVFAKDLQISQSAISKIERAELIPSSSQWFNICHVLKIHPEKTFTSGYIDHCSTLTSDQTNYPDQAFKLPPEYSFNKGSSVRTSLPFLNFFKKKLGEKKLHEYIEYKKIDPDFFVVLDNQINIQFILDITSELTTKGYLNKKTLPEMTKIVGTPASHGNLSKEYVDVHEHQHLVRRLIKNINRYEINFKYEIINETKECLDISSHTNEIIRDFKIRNEVLGNFINEYRNKYIESFSTIAGLRRAKTSIIESSINKGVEKCIFRVNLATV